MTKIARLGLLDIPYDGYPWLIQKLGTGMDAVPHYRNLCRNDLYFLLRYVFKRPDMEHPWIYDRCREVQAEPNGYLDLWARNHYKSTIITYGKTIQDILRGHGEDPTPEWTLNSYHREPTFVIFSFNRPTAKGFLDQIKRELQGNVQLKGWFPDILYMEPEREAETWSLDSGLLVKRKSNPKEKTVQAFGLIDGMPTGGHWVVRIYDDVITEASARSPEMVEKATEQWALSLNLGTHGINVERYIGTRYGAADTYRTMMLRNAAEPRIYPATDDGSPTGNPVLLTPEELAVKYERMGPYIFGCQMLQNPMADEKMSLKREWLRFHDGVGEAKEMNLYLLCDPANEKKKDSDHTAMGIVGLGPDMNYYLVEGIYDRLNLDERTDALIHLHRKWKPLGVGYEQYGKDSDIQHIRYVQKLQNYRFDITALGGAMAKPDRIRRMVPDLVRGGWWWPKEQMCTSWDNRAFDLIEKILIEEYDVFPLGAHEDFLDMLSRIYDSSLRIVWPKAYTPPSDRYQKSKGARSWTSA